ncbi:Inner membrane protein yagU [Yersinia nurmii]|uniref:Inner membrane protein yagU n=1 Tax=Yersinia nurmii TaxID=685706 RepID=A0ABM9S512_9GAMM|nr:Inner membrane protein yagU [Yersinia nurmii]
MKLSFATTQKKYRNYSAALWAGFLGGNIASFVKWGTEIPFPPRTADRAIPPAEMLQDLGFKVSDMTYQYSGHIINWGVAGVHHLFSILFALFYCLVAEVFPAIKLWQGAAFAILVTLGFHGVLLPLFGWGPPLWQLPFHELLSEMFGHVVWMWTIEIFRRDIRNRITHQPDPEFQPQRKINRCYRYLNPEYTRLDKLAKNPTPNKKL